MTAYTKSTNFATKDTLTSGDPLKIVKGTEINTEFDNIQTAVNSKADTASPTFTGTVTIPTLSVSSTSTLTGVATLTANPVLSAGTANGVTYLNGSKSLTSGSAITFDGTNFATTGTATATKLIPTGSSVTGNGLYLPAANALGLSTNGTNAVYIDASQNVGIGTSSPGVKLDVNGALRVGLASNPTTIASNSQFYDQSGVGPTISGYNFTVRTGNPTPAEAMRIDSSGNLLVGTTSVVSVGAGAHILSLRASSQSWGVGPTGAFASFYIKSASSTGVVLSTSATAWASDSDERKKTTITPFENAINKVCSLRAGTGRYLTDEESMSRSFLIAQDVQSVLPEAVDIGEDIDQSLMLRYTDVIPLLVAAIQEQQALITALTARITALENK
jgi:hypothetical protein